MKTGSCKNITSKKEKERGKEHMGKIKINDALIQEVENPCKNCDKRCVGCHGICKAYRRWKRIDSIRKQIVHQRKRVESSLYHDAVWQSACKCNRG